MDFRAYAKEKESARSSAQEMNVMAHRDALEIALAERVHTAN
jgi:hypothetical protein